MAIFIYISIAIHEMGHVVGGKLISVDNLAAYIWPGIELYPDLGSVYEDVWPNNEIAFTQHIPPSINILDYSNTPPWNNSSITLLKKSPTEFDLNIIKLMGSGLTFILSLIAMLFIYLLRPSGKVLLFATFGVLLNYDLLFYSVLPLIFNLPHLIFWGGNTAEPINALSKMYFSKHFWLTVVIIISTLQYLFLYRYHSKIKN